jgi:hypothetical protein
MEFNYELLYSHNLFYDSKGNCFRDQSYKFYSSDAQSSLEIKCKLKIEKYFK